MTNRLAGMFTQRYGRVVNYAPASVLTRLMASCTPQSQHSRRFGFCRPGLRYGVSPQKKRLSGQRSWLDRLVCRCLTSGERRRYKEGPASAWLEGMSQRAQALRQLTSIQLDASRTALKQKMRHNGSNDDTLDDALAHVLIAVEKTQGLLARTNQCLAAHALLQGHCVELATGEGKTLGVALAAGAAALSGTPVHVLTANDYLAVRDASNMASAYQLLGLRVTSVTSALSLIERRRAYTSDIVYVTAKQVAFDWLSDALELGTEPDSITVRLAALARTDGRPVYKPVLRGLCLGIVDEADSLLVDEARIPLVLAAPKPSDSAEETEAVIALGIAEQLQEGVDYTVASDTRLVQLSDSGCIELEKISRKVKHVWRSSRYREERVRQALTVLHQYERDLDYIVRDGCLELMDAHTGRAMPDRRLPHGLHRLLELKEKCTPTPQHETIATVPFQHFFGRYIELVGVSGTLHEVAGEINQIYNRSVVKVAPHRPNCRKDLQAEVFSDRSSQLQAMVLDVQRRLKLEQPVLVCTRSVEQSMGVSALLRAHGLQHQVLNAYQDAQEAMIVAAAGRAGQLTVATNMAGRGTDIPLGPRVTKLGGLHVISLAFNDASRLDRQLAGRAARQGDPGSYQQLCSLDDPYLIKAMPAVVRRCALTCVDRGWQRAAMMLIRWMQKRMECKHKEERLVLFQSREKLEHQLAFGGKPEHLS